ncbi:MAG: PleD family two-component system response regulator [Alphaproteobacteria bacterium]
MTARVLIIDDTEANVILLTATLTADYYDVVTATSGEAGLQRARSDPPDLVLLDVMMPGLDGFQVCRFFKADPQLAHIPVVLVTALSRPEDRVKGLEAGADDFLTKPVDTMILMARVKNLVRTKIAMDELRQRCASTRVPAEVRMRVNAEDRADAPAGPDARILLVTDDPGIAPAIGAAIEGLGVLEIKTMPEDVIWAIQQEPYDLVMLTMGLRSADPMRLCSQVRSTVHTRHVPILMISDADHRALLPRAYDIGINDSLDCPLDPAEVRARVKAQLRQKRYHDDLRTTIDRTMEMAYTDVLTGLYNRTFLDGQLPRLFQETRERNQPLAVLLFDLDAFKAINDTYGHAAGDEVLRQFARTLQNGLRSHDVAFRIGGEEFLVLMPRTGFEAAHAIAERVRDRVACFPFFLPQIGRDINVTVSAGVHVHQGDPVPLDALLAPADAALYRAKDAGRNRVMAAA